MSRSKRADVLDAAEVCFYGSGIAASGVDTIAARASVSKRTLYNHFASKDDLVVAYLQRREQRWRDTVDEILALSDPRERLTAYVTAYVAPVREGEPYRGCPQLNAAAELPDDHPALAVVAASKRDTIDDLVRILSDLGATNPVLAARTAALMLEGSCSLFGALRENVDTTPLLTALIATT